MEKEFEESGGEWKEIPVGDLFNKRTMKGFPKRDENLSENKKGYHIFGQNIKYQYPQKVLLDEKYLHKVDSKKPILAYTSSASEIGMIEESFYRSGDNGAFQGLFPKFNKYNRKHMLYFLAILSKHFVNFEYSTGMSNVLSLIIQVPFIKNQLAFSYMESYINTLEAERIETLEAYLQITNLKDYKLTRNDKKILDMFEKLNDTKSRVEEWREYTFEQLFNIYTGRDVIIGKTEIGNTPLISHQHQNNGIAQRIKNLSDRRLFDNKTTLSLADRGVFCSKSQSEKFHIGTRVKALEFKDGEKNKEVQLFFVSTINKLQILFTEYSSNATDKLPDLNIQLPTKNGEVDYQFMSDFIRVIEKIVIKDVIEWTDRKIEATKEVISNE